jgi:hypothetical protein
LSEATASVPSAQNPAQTNTRWSTARLWGIAGIVVLAHLRTNQR